MNENQPKTKRNRAKLNKTKRNLKPLIPTKALCKKYLALLKNLYPNCEIDNSSENKELDGYKITYGEMTYQGIEMLYNLLFVQNSRKLKFFASDNKVPSYFLDVGSGKGKLCLYMASKDNIIKSIGVELVKDRHNSAVELKKSLSEKGMQVYTNKTTLLNNDIFKVMLPNKLYVEPSSIFVWISNLCFEEEHTVKIFEKMMDELPVDSIICSSKPYSGQDNRLVLIDTVQLPMSWNDKSNVSIYKIVVPEVPDEKAVTNDSEEEEGTEEDSEYDSDEEGSEEGSEYDD
jgi:hypothetical protein